MSYNIPTTNEESTSNVNEQPVLELSQEFIDSITRQSEIMAQKYRELMNSKPTEEEQYEIIDTISF